MDRKRVALAFGAALLALGVLAFVAIRAGREPEVSVTVAPGPNARTEDAPEH